MSFGFENGRAKAGESRVVLSVAPINLPGTGRGTDLQVRVSAPAEGDDLPIIIFSHGNGQSLHSYGPLVNHWAAHGFAVIQPSHLDSRAVGLPPEDPRRPDLWRYREQDLLTILEKLDLIEKAVPTIQGRLDRTRISVAGHSWGAQTASTLLGAVHPDPRDGSVVNGKDPRIKAGVLLAVPGRGGKDLSNFARSVYPFLHSDFTKMTTPTMIVMGDSDQSGLTVRGPDWWRDAYDLSPSPKALYVVFGGKHSLGGIPGYESRETTDERPERVAAIQMLSTAFLRRALYAEAPDWHEAVAESASSCVLEGAIEVK